MDEEKIKQVSYLGNWQFQFISQKFEPDFLYQVAKKAPDQLLVCGTGDV